MIKEAIQTLVGGKDLTYEEAYFVMGEIMGGEATPAQIGAFLTALRVKGETADEIAGLAAVMQNKATPVKTDGPAIDIVGTGGDGTGSFNLSTAAAFVAAGAGLKVAKHGNRAMSSQCGSADVLEALGVKIDLNAAQVEECIRKVGMGFMFAQVFHPAMRYAAPVRRELGIRTVFNILGPLTNPAKVEYILLGAANEDVSKKLAVVIQRMGTKHALVVYGKEGIDEVSISGKTIVWEIVDNKLSKPYEISPESFGLKTIKNADIKGGTPQENASQLEKVLNGEKGVLRDAVVINSAAALYAGNKTKDLKEAARIAQETIDSGRAKDILERLAVLTLKLGQDGENDTR
jgi:anthranilate phosphoribosyltransferase